MSGAIVHGLGVVEINVAKGVLSPFASRRRGRRLNGPIEANTVRQTRERVMGGGMSELALE